jgi:beta-lactamase regulating signal transducer with metallopeptidase domain
MLTVRRTIVMLAMLVAPRAADACPVCFGRSDSPLALATNLGVLTLLGVVVGVLGSFAAFFVYLARRARLVDSLVDSNETS